MESIRTRVSLLLKKRSAWVFILVALVFAAAIAALFTYERQRLDTEIERMITGSLNIHTEDDAAQIDNSIEDAGRALKTAQTIFQLTKGKDPQEYLEQRNATNPVYFIKYSAMERVRANPSLFFNRADQEKGLSLLEQGQLAVGDILQDKDSGGYSLAVLLPLRESGAVTGILYVCLDADKLLLQNSESVVYQDVQSMLVTSDWEIAFNTLSPGQEGGLLDTLGAYNLSQEEIDRIADIVRSPETDSTAFHRGGELYYASSAPLRHNGWSLVSFARGPDVLLRSAGIFRDTMRTSIIAVLITAAASCAIFLQLRYSRKKLEEEERRNYAFVKRFQAMFEQHSALKVVVDTATGEIVDANPAILRYFGVTREEALGRNIQAFNMLPPEVQLEKMQGEMGEGALYQAAPHRLRSGELRLLDVYASVIRNEGRRLLYAILFDVTDREQYRDALLQEKELLRTTLQSIGDGVVTTDNLGNITSINSVAEKMTGWNGDETLGRSFSEVFLLQNEETRETVENPIQKVLETGLVIGLANHTELVDRQGRRTPIADSAAPIRKEGDPQTLGVVMVFRDVSSEKAHSKEVEYLSYHDPLTGLYNRRYIEEAMLRLDEEECLPISVIMADVNGLKITNDVFGHRAGDVLLKNVADLMRRCCNENNLVARLGGDEFVILMPGTELEAAESVIQRIKAAHIGIEGSSLSLSLSLGCACKDTARMDMQAALQRAEEYMYQQKLLDGKSYRNAIISTLLATLYEKSNETEAHSKRLETYCHAIGRQLQLSSKEMDELSLLALLHDIGKVGVNPNILQKPGSLTPVEWDEVKRHTEIGYRIAQVTPELAAVAELILSHHERWDGAGYPRRLKETEIPLACRILSVVDAYDAMTSDRAYRRAMTVNQAVAELKRNVGTQFDPQMAGLLIEIIIEEGKSGHRGGSS